MFSEEMKQMPTVCPLCPNHCPKEELHCGRGRAFFANLERNFNPEMEGPRPPHPHHGHRPHHRPEGPVRHHGPGMEAPDFPHPERPDFPRPEINENSSLDLLLGACSHRMRRGVRGGRHDSQAQVLKILSMAGGSADQRDLQEAMRIRPASCSELISKLEAKGLVERQRDEDDRRKVQIFLTEKGKERSQKTGLEARTEFFEVLDTEEQETLRRLLLKLLENGE